VVRLDGAQHLSRVRRPACEANSGRIGREPRKEKIDTVKGDGRLIGG